VGLRSLVGAGDRSGLFVLPFAIAGLGAWYLAPSLVAVPRSAVVDALGFALVAPGLVVWAWSVVLILAEVPKGKLITSGPFRLVRHPLYTAVGLLALPGLGLLLGTWLGLFIGAALYVAARIFAPEEERALAQRFGSAWDDYDRNVRVSWL